MVAISSRRRAREVSVCLRLHSQEDKRLARCCPPARPIAMCGSPPHAANLPRPPRLPAYYAWCSRPGCGRWTATPVAARPQMCVIVLAPGCARAAAGALRRKKVFTCCGPCAPESWTAGRCCRPRRPRRQCGRSARGRRSETEGAVSGYFFGGGRTRARAGEEG